MLKKILLSTFIVFAGGLFMVAPVFADSNCVRTAVLGNSACDSDGNKIRDIDDSHPLASGEFACSCDSGSGSSTFMILKIVIDIMTVGIGILGVVGITIVGIQYLTAGGNEEKTRKAKRRLYEIVIGLVAYVLIYAFLQWLLPNFDESLTPIQGQAYIQSQIEFF